MANTAFFTQSNASSGARNGDVRTEVIKEAGKRELEDVSRIMRRLGTLFQQGENHGDVLRGVRQAVTGFEQIENGTYQQPGTVAPQAEAAAMGK